MMRKTANLTWAVLCVVFLMVACTPEVNDDGDNDESPADDDDDNDNNDDDTTADDDDNDDDNNDDDDNDNNDTVYLEKVDGEPGVNDVGWTAAMALDATGVPHLSYCAATLEELKYAYRPVDEWVFSTVADVGEEESFTGIAVDDYGAPHILFDDYWGRVNYATLEGKAWTIVELEGGCWGYTNPGLAIDGDGVLHGVWNKEFIRYANTVSGSWSVPEDIWDGGSPSIAVDSYGRPHAAFGSGEHIWYGVRDGSWSLDNQADPAVGNCPWVVQTSIVLGALNAPTISYCDCSGADGNLGVTRKVGSSWIRGTPDAVGEVGEFNALALDAAGHAHLVYSDETGGTVNYATNVTGSWTTAVVANVPGQWMSIALYDDLVYFAYIAGGGLWFGWFPQGYGAK